MKEDQVVNVLSNMAELYRRNVTELQGLPTDDATCYEAMELIRSLIERIEVHEGEECGKPGLVLVGALAQILAFTRKRKTASRVEDGGRVLQVSGAGFGHDPTRHTLRKAD